MSLKRDQSGSVPATPVWVWLILAALAWWLPQLELFWSYVLLGLLIGVGVVSWVYVQMTGRRRRQR